MEYNDNSFYQHSCTGNSSLWWMLFSHLVMFNFLWSQGLQHARLPCPSPSPGVCSNSCPLSQWCRPSHLCPLLLFLPSIVPSIRVFFNESALRIMWPKYWSFNFSPSNEYSGLISFRTDWFDLLAIWGTLKSLLQHHSSKASILLKHYSHSLSTCWLTEWIDD